MQDDTSSLDHQCWVESCWTRGEVEAIGTWSRQHGVDRTIAMVLCRRHVEALGDDLVVLETA